MPHIHPLIDFVIVAFIICQDKILLIFHSKLNKWLPVGGHIELDEDPEQALFREIKEETGLNNIKILSGKPLINSRGTKFLYTPIFLDIHNISKTHKHIGLTYFVKAKNHKVKLAEREHKDIRWFSERDIDDKKWKLSPAVKFYAKEALKYGKN
jgi:8-oxo-dGTP pyrophosphatase MutT (NUDIX family)